ncbi:hypothetical protein [Kordia sp.]|uniref:hypothetical protein n=1 Tax=Kordia sp. TaxID=1965332 RepID=UPI003B5B566D
MSKQKILTYLYFFLALADALGVVFSDIIHRKYTTFLPVPVLFILYLYSVKKVNWLYIFSLIFTFIGIIFFNIQSYFNIALIFYALGVCLYVVISLKTAEVIPVKNIGIATIPFLIVYLVPFILYSDAVQSEVFNYIIFYVFFVGLFFFISILVYVNKQNTANLWLFSSGIVFLFSTIIHGYNIFFEFLVPIRVGVVITFLFMHYAMYRYTVLKTV